MKQKLNFLVVLIITKIRRNSLRVSGRYFSLMSYSLFLMPLFLFSLCLTPYASFSQGVGINTDGSNAHSSAGLDVKFTDKGVIIPRLTTAQRDNIATACSCTPAEGLLIFNTTTKCFEAYVNGAWNTVSCPAACTPPAAPVDNAVSDIACTSFTANWTASAGATAYLLDVATDAGFTSFVAGYNNLNVGNVTSSPVTGLTAGTAYYYRVRATTACVSGNSGTQNPTTLAAPTAAPTAGAHTPSQTQIVWNWNAVAGATGYKWNTANNYATATDNGASTTKTQTGLTCNTAYTLYVWAYNACGNFSTPVTLTQTTSSCWSCGSAITDARDSKSYNTVLIGSQCWMAENLNYGTYAAVTTPQVAGTKFCQNLSGVNDAACPFGGLYEWANMMNGSASCNGTGAPPNDKCATNVQGLCPAGWHVPSHYEWTTLEKNVGSNPGAFPYDVTTTGWLGTDEGGNLKQTGTTNWTTPNTGATNTSGFLALPGGFSWAGSFLVVGDRGVWWSATESGGDAWIRRLDYTEALVLRSPSNKPAGSSVRCVKD